jgi:hypothetical protein
MNRNKRTNEILTCGLVMAGLLLITSGNAKADFAFGTPENLGPAVNSAYLDGIFDISSDDLELYFECDRPSSAGDSDIWITTRATVADLWEPAVKLGAPVNGPHSDYGPCIARDGLSLYFSSTRPGGSGGADIYVATRPTIEDSWGQPGNLGAIVNNSSWDHCPSISADGLTLVFGSNREKRGTAYSTLCYIYATTRHTTDDPWGVPVRLGPAVNPGLAYDSDYPSISADGLSLYFRRQISDTIGLWAATRRSTSEPWERVVDLGMKGASPRFSVDGSIMYVTSRAYGGYGDADLFQVPTHPIVDFNGDGIIDLVDMVMLINHWETNDTLFDIGPMPWGDSVVDIEDLQVFITHWEEVNAANP